MESCSIQAIERVLVVRRCGFSENFEIGGALGRRPRDQGFSRSGDAARAEPLFREWVVKVTRFLGPDNLDVSEVLTSPGRNFQQLGRFAEAEGPLRRSLAALRVVYLSAGQPDTARTRLILEYVLAGEEECAEAQERAATLGGRVLRREKRRPRRDRTRRRRSTSRSTSAGSSGRGGKRSSKARGAVDARQAIRGWACCGRPRMRSTVFPSTSG